MASHKIPLGFQPAHRITAPTHSCTHAPAPHLHRTVANKTDPVSYSYSPRLLCCTAGAHAIRPKHLQCPEKGRGGRISQKRKGPSPKRDGGLQCAPAAVDTTHMKISHKQTNRAIIVDHGLPRKGILRPLSFAAWRLVCRPVLGSPERDICAGTLLSEDNCQATKAKIERGEPDPEPLLVEQNRRGVCNKRDVDGIRVCWCLYLYIQRNVYSKKRYSCFVIIIKPHLRPL
ncbi:hypothetical protein F5883DRAFT_90395 [Diaporthe sp. PMI_573]|nr:hypothetical protein F5883DRAFT_90395 [Diaporthaceae sp. PMI_573]